MVSVNIFRQEIALYSITIRYCVVYCILWDKKFCFSCFLFMEEVDLWNMYHMDTL